MRHIDKIIVHCTATPEGRHVTVKDVDNWHRAKKWNGIGYHYLIYLDGSIHAGRPESTIGAHCYGYNKHSIGVCYVGGTEKNRSTSGRLQGKNVKKEKDTRTPEQKAALAKILTELHQRYPKATLHGHREFANKACPSFDVSEYQYIFNDNKSTQK